MVLPRPALVSCDSDDAVLILCHLLPHIPNAWLALPRRLVAKALLGMVNLNMLLLDVCRASI
jgi:hypothetical protein